VDVPFDRADLDEEPGCYFPVGEALGDQREHLLFACGERLGKLLILPLGVPAGYLRISARVWRFEGRQRPLHVAE
jgi:hypothetical protein